MVKQLGAVLKSHEQKCRSLGVGGLVAGGLVQVVVTLCVASQRNSVQNSLPFISMGLLFLGVHLWSHLREQFLNFRRSTWPTYVLPQTIVFTIMAVLIALVWPLTLAFLSGGGLGLAAMSSVFFALLGWCIVTWSMMLMLATMGAYLAACVGMVPQGIPVYLDAHATAEIILLISGVFSAGAAVWRLTQIDEANRTYSKKVSLQSSGALPKMTGQMVEPQGSWSGLRTWFTPRLESYIPRAGGQWERSRRLRRLRKSVLWSSAVIATAMIAPQLLVGDFLASTSGGSPRFLFPLLVFLFISSNSVATSWLQSWRFVELEMIRPVRRQTLLKDVAYAMAIQSLQVWAFMTAVIVAVLIVKGDLTHQATGLTALLAVSLASQVLNLTVSFLVMSFRSPGGIALAGFPVAFAGASIIGPCYFYSSAAKWIIPLGVGGQLLLAAMFLRIATRVWERTDLG